MFETTIAPASKYCGSQVASYWDVIALLHFGALVGMGCFFGKGVVAVETSFSEAGLW